MEVTVGPPAVIRSGTGLTGPSRARTMGVPGAATAPQDCLQAVGGVPWLSPGTRHPWSGSPVGRISCGALLRGEAGRSPSPRDDTRTHEPLATGGTPLRMDVPPLCTHRLPVQRCWRLHRRLAQRRTTASQGRRMARMVQPIRPHAPRLGYGHMQQPALEKVGDGQGHLLEPRTRAISLLMTGATGEGDAGAVVRHQAAVLEGTAPQIASQIRHHPSPAGIAFHDAHMPARLPRMAETVEQIEYLLRTQPLRHHQLPARPRTPDRVEHLAPKHRHDDPCREQKPMADGLPVPVW